jgi:hypothetical protein
MIFLDANENPFENGVIDIDPAKQCKSGFGKTKKPQNKSILLGRK